MPYINNDDKRRNVLAKGNDEPRTEGELNFKITLECHRYLERFGVKYANINAVIGVLECAKLELYRQIAAPYEREKHKFNGSVSELDRKGSDE